MHDLVREPGELGLVLLEVQRLRLAPEGEDRLDDDEMVDPVRHLLELDPQHEQLVVHREHVDDLALAARTETWLHLVEHQPPDRPGEFQPGVLRPCDLAVLEMTRERGQQGNRLLVPARPRQGDRLAKLDSGTHRRLVRRPIAETGKDGLHEVGG